MTKKKPEELEKAFSELLSKSALVGRFTVDGKEGIPSEDRYEIGKVAKVKDDLWIFTGIKYGKKDISLPLVIRVVWAENTPVMTMDKFTIPGLGTFSFRILFDGNRYAGTWQHDDHGGHMWGRIERVSPEAKPAEARDPNREGARLQDKLKQSIPEIDLRNSSLERGLETLGKTIGVSFQISLNDLKAAGLPRNMRVNVHLKETTARDALRGMLSELPLCVVVDETAKLVLVTTVTAAEEQGFEPLDLK